MGQRHRHRLRRSPPRIRLTIAGAYGLELDTKVCDAQDLPFGDDTFDVVLSAFGAMFARDQRRVADELVRVCRPGGRIGMANWKPDSLVGDVLRTGAVR
jgi:ubiquinone/menaquinone biosynthesis C-methylase UbiE